LFLDGREPVGPMGVRVGLQLKAPQGVESAGG
jgi:hypothetical protein